MNGTNEDRARARRCLQMALEAGAQKARVSLNSNVMDLVATLDGAVDRITHCFDRSLSLALFADGRYGVFSTNKIDDEAQLRAFVQQSLALVRMLEAEPLRDLPDPARTAKDAREGDEAGLFDPAYGTVGPEQRKGFALFASPWGAAAPDGSWRLISEEGEYSDSLYEQYIVDSQGLECLHRETAFEYGIEVTIQDRRGDRYSGYWWDSAAALRDFDPSYCGRKAVQEAAAAIGPRRLKSGRYRAVIDREAASRLVSPILKALGGYAIQQDNSFLRDALDKQVFPAGMNLRDCPRSIGQTGARFFDSEGVATRDRDIVREGTVRTFFLNSFMAAKTGLAPTTEEPVRPVLEPFWSAASPQPKHIGRDELMRLCGDGILVTGFNGGNSNSATGDFSYGVEGFRFKDGKILHPVNEMVMTGNFLPLWAGLLGAGTDARACQQKSIGSLAFEGVDFSGT